jgi:sugar phosphate isomerase/epimerase
VLVIGSPKQRNLLPASRSTERWSTRPRCSPRAAGRGARGVTLAMEPLGPQETDFLNTAEQTMQLVRRLNHPNFQINLDVKAMSSEAEADPAGDPRDGRAHRPRAGERPEPARPGMGDVRYEPIVAALKEVGYDGWLSVEAFDFRPGAEHIARQSIEYLRQVAG